FDAASTTDSADIEKALFDGDVRFIVTRKNVAGFTIVLNKPAPADVSFSWIALAVKGAKLFTSRDLTAPAPADTNATTTTATSTAVVVVPPTSTTTPNPVITPPVVVTPT